MATKTKQNVPAVIGVPVVDATVAIESTTIGSFIAGIGPFFQRAGELERMANAELADMRTFTEPTSLDEDVALVEAVKGIKAGKKALSEHWAGRNVFHSFHKKLVAAMARAEGPLDEAEAIGNRLHNAYVAKEKARALAEAEAERKRLEALERQRQEALAADLEAQALAAEADRADLSEREQRFVELMMNGYNTPESAATAAGYKDRYIGQRLAGTPKIMAAIEAAKSAAELRRQSMAVKSQPVAATPTTQAAQVATEGRTYQSATILDPAAFVAAALAGTHGIPADALMPNQTVLNGYARSLGERTNLWPGVTLKKDTKL